MKIQDLIFVCLFALILWQKSIRLSVTLGIICLLLAIPLFKFWVFFTAERLTWYAAAFFAYGVLLGLTSLTRRKR